MSQEDSIRLIDRHHADAQPLLHIYEQSFPENESIESERYYDTLEEYAIDIHGIYSGGKLVGLFNIMHRLQNGIVYFWFFAIAPQYRNKGIGGKALELLKQQYPDCQMVLDMEPLDESAENYDERMRRTHFYERHGFSRSGRGMTYFRQSFEIMCTNAPFRESDFRKHYDEPIFAEWKPQFFDIKV